MVITIKVKSRLVGRKRNDDPLRATVFDTLVENNIFHTARVVKFEGNSAIVEIEIPEEEFEKLEKAIKGFRKIE